MDLAALIDALQRWGGAETHACGHCGRIVVLLRWACAHEPIRSDVFTNAPADARAGYLAQAVLDACLLNGYLEPEDGRPAPRLWRVEPVALRVSPRGRDVLARAAGAELAQRAA